MKKRIFAMLLTLALLLSTVVVIGVSAEVTADDAIVAKVGETDLTLNELLTQMKSGSATYTLTSDIVLGSSFTTVHPFAGTLDGAGHKISGLTVPFINKLDGGTIKNLTLEGNITTTGGTAGILAFQTTGTVTLENVTTNGTITHERDVAINLAGMIGNGNDATISFKNCVNNVNLICTAGNATTVANTYVGGFVAQFKGDLTFEGCINNGDMTIESTKTTLVGGFAGYNYNYKDGGSSKNVTFNNCANYGDIFAKDGGSTGCKAGGFLGIAEKSSAVFSFTNCYNAGNISAYCMAGGFLGDDRAFDTRFVNCVNDGDVNAYGAGSDNCFAGGFVGQLYGTGTDVLPVVQGCINNGAISIPDTRTDGAAHVGGFFGISSMNFTTFADNINTGAVTGGKYAGGLISKFGPADNSGKNNTTFAGNLVTATVSGDAAGGFWGMVQKGGEIEVINSFYLGADAAAFGENSGSATFACTLGNAASTDPDDAGKSAEELKALSPTTDLFVQESAVDNGKFNVRFLAGVSSLAYSKIGFQIIRIELNGKPSNTLKKDTTTVYTAVKGFDPDTQVETTYEASYFDGASYVTALTVNNVPTDVTVSFIVRPYVVSVDGNTTVYGNVSTVTYNAVQQ